MKAMRWSVVVFERTVNSLETEKRLSFAHRRKLQTVVKKSKLLNLVPLVFLSFSFNVQNVFLRYYSKEASELIWFVSELSSWKRRSKEVGEKGVHREDETVFAPSILYLECKMYTQYTQSNCSSKQCLQGIMQ